MHWWSLSGKKNRLHSGCSRFPVTSPSIQSNKKLRHKPGLIVLYEIPFQSSPLVWCVVNGGVRKRARGSKYSLYLIMKPKVSLQFCGSVANYTDDGTLLTAAKRQICVLYICLVWNICILIVLHYYILEKESAEERSLCEHINDWKEFENEWAWRDFLIWLPL